MDNLRFSRRNFISAVGVTGAATLTNIAPLQSLANIPEKNLPPDRVIKMISTINLSDKEQEKIRAVSKNIDLQIVNDSSAVSDDAEVVIGDVNAAMLQRLKKLKWVQVWHAGVENTPKEMIGSPVVLTNMQRVLGPVIAESAIAIKRNGDRVRKMLCSMIFIIKLSALLEWAASVPKLPAVCIMDLA